MKRFLVLILGIIMAGLISYRVSHGVAAQAAGQFSSQPQMRYAANVSIAMGTPVVSTASGCTQTSECVTPANTGGFIAGIAITSNSANGPVYIAQYGAALCSFDSAPKIGDSVTVVPGFCHDEPVNTRLTVSFLAGYVGRVISVPDQTTCPSTYCANVNIIAPGTTGLMVAASQMDSASMPAYIKANQNTSIGPQGITGATGPAGAQGVQGPSGPIGTTGNAGNPGSDGRVGPMGPAGVAGATGAQGPQGSTGAQGISAYAVAQGQGFAGTISQWLASLIGATGANGANGSVGPAGPTGNTGPAGSTGSVGPTGPSGVAGPVGPAGPVGAVGQTGNTGATGVQGPQGASGITYLSGVTNTVGGTALLVGGRITATTTVTGATVGTPCVASATTGVAPVPGIYVSCSVTAANTATVSLTAMIASTPASASYNVGVLP